MAKETPFTFTSTCTQHPLNLTPLHIILSHPTIQHRPPTPGILYTYILSQFQLTYPLNTPTCEGKA